MRDEECTMTFGFESTTDDVLAGKDLSGQRFLVTGASAGLGVETIRALSAHGATVTGVARDLDKARRALGDAGAKDIELVEADLASLASVRRAADSLKGRTFDVLIANAGVMCTPEGRTADGFETQLGTNHIGHFVLINRLAPQVADGGRIVLLSSAAHRICDVSLDDPLFEKSPYEPWQAYGRSKTANALHALELDRRLKKRGVRVASVHPGGIMTELGRHMTPELIEQMMARRPSSGPNAMRFKSVPQGAATSVWCAVTAPADAIGGRYCADCNVSPVSDDDNMNAVKSYATDAAHAAALWDKTEGWAGERFAL
jgi:NAD(P)-dependent dehydrogenase (short-subunit alcohol dehydrogenase family)